MKPVQRWDPATYATHARYVPELGLEVVDLLAPQPGERVLDLGCGDGVLTMRLLAAGCSVIGIDSSEAQVAAARSRGIDARVGHAEALEFHDEFDAVFSNAALHWVKDARAAAGSAFRALKPGGRFVGELGGAGNVAAIRQAVERALRRRGIDPDPLNPWYFPDAGQYRALLEDAGFRVGTINLFSRPTRLDTGLEGWLTVFAQAFLSVLSADERRLAVEQVSAETAPALQDQSGTWFADYVRLRFSAERPPAP